MNKRKFAVHDVFFLLFVFSKLLELNYTELHEIFSNLLKSVIQQENMHCMP